MTKGAVHFLIIYLLLPLLSGAAFAMTTNTDLPPRPLRIMTLNIAHGRKDRFHQLFLFPSTIRSHLDEIADMIVNENADIVALQEADGPCWWSGRRDHVQYIADRAGMPYSYRGTHNSLFYLSYGTAILSKLPLERSESISFPSSWPTPPKGFVVSQLTWNGTALDIVSLHLDFLRTSVQQEQVGLLVNTLSKRNRPLIVMGDFNCGWDDNGDAAETSPIQMLCKQLDLKAYRPDTKAGLESYGNRNPTDRLDWILISAREGDFSDYCTLPEIVSDHLAVLSDVQLADGGV